MPVTTAEISRGLGVVAELAQSLPEPVGRIVSALALLGQRACSINPTDPVKVIEDASLAVVEAAANAKYGA